MSGGYNGNSQHNSLAVALTAISQPYFTFLPSAIKAGCIAQQQFSRCSGTHFNLEIIEAWHKIGDRGLQHFLTFDLVKEKESRRDVPTGWLQDLQILTAKGYAGGPGGSQYPEGWQCLRIQYPQGQCMVPANYITYHLTIDRGHMQLNIMYLVQSLLKSPSIT